MRAVADVTGSGGRVLIPAFALGRAQEIAMIMRRHLPEVPVRLDGMAAELATVFESLDPALRVFGEPPRSRTVPPNWTPSGPGSSSPRPAC